jgi:hypothetical protein
VTRNDYPVFGHEDHLTGEEYEDIYHEALHCLGENSSVGFPFQRPDGRRVCEVDARLLLDDQVIELWWGKDIAEQVRRERGGSGGKFKSHSGHG